MIKFEHTKVLNFEGALRGMRNPLNSWDKSDSYDGYACYECHILKENGICEKEDRGQHCEEHRGWQIGTNDLKLAKNLIKAGADHRKFARQIFVSVDIIAPLYWWKEFDTYKVGTTSNSCSTMHTIHTKEITLDDFSCENLMDYGVELLEKIIKALNNCRDIYNNGYIGNGYTIKPKSKEYWYEMIQLLPTSYNQRRTITFSYENLINMYHARKHHKLDEWLDFCKWVETLPYSELITE